MALLVAWRDLNGFWVDFVVLRWWWGAAAAASPALKRKGTEDASLKNRLK
jgi:hypothetical protein